MYKSLDEKTAYLLRNPIRTPSQMPSKVKTRKIDTDWENRMKDVWWYHKNNSIPENPHFDNKMFELRTKLLEFGGQETCLPICDEDIDAILSRGQLWYGDRIHMMRGAPSQCHRNSCSCWNANKGKVVICTGYALSEDSIWRQHSWLVELRPRKNRIVETTTPRVLYFGFAMSEEEAENFYYENF